MATWWEGYCGNSGVIAGFGLLIVDRWRGDSCLVQRRLTDSGERSANLRPAAVGQGSTLNDQNLMLFGTYTLRGGWGCG